MLAYSFEKNKINAKFENCPPGFSLPVEFEINGKSILVNVTHTTGVVYSGKFKKSEVKLKTSSLLINTKWKKRL
jgi:hypothetical protein